MAPTILLFAALALAAGGEDEIRGAEKAWAAAVTSGDIAGLERILGDGLIYAHSTGAIESKAEYLARLQTGAQKYKSIEHRGIVVKLYGDSAVAHSKVRMTGVSNDRVFDDELMMLHLWVKQGGRWRLAAHQTTKLQ